MAATTPSTTPEPQLRPPEPPTATFLCAMWQGRCGRPAHLIIDVFVRIGSHNRPLSWLCCDDLRCICASQNHAASYGLVHVYTRRVTPPEAVQHVNLPAVA